MDNRAATETIGVILLVAVVFVASATLGTGLIVQTSAVEETSDSSQLNIKSELTNETVTLRHVGGPSFETDNVLFYLEGDDGRVGPYSLAEIDTDGSIDGEYTGDQTFSVGDEVTLNHSFSGYVRATLLDRENDKLLYTTLRSPTSEGAGPAASGQNPVANITSPDETVEGFSIDLNGTNSFDADSSIVSYEWVLAGNGSLENTSASTATYNAPPIDGVTDGNETVTISLTVEDNDGNTNTVSKQVTIRDFDAVGSGTAFDDPNGNGIQDPGETTYTESELENFDNDSVDLVIYSDFGEVKASGSQVDITANTITAGNDFTSSGKSISLTATGDVIINGATLEAKGNKGISITSTNGIISANNTQMRVTGGGPNKGPITFNSNGNLYLVDADLDASGYNADLGTTSATLYWNGLTLTGNPLKYGPSGVNTVPTDGASDNIEPA
ncbi:type IV pilin [Halorubrum halophilum]|uniref:PKD domain-containing protein n=1 Tax=Halorubrum halophilum TaxID=413816 RepID=UPI00186B5240|nr:type IV pilin [Halorubrum halophilum]